MLDIQSILKEKGYLVGAIRQPTVKSAIIRLIARITSYNVCYTKLLRWRKT